MYFKMILQYKVKYEVYNKQRSKLLKKKKVAIEETTKN